MTSKLRRAPLFTYNDMGTRCLASFGGTPTPPGAPPAHPAHPAHPSQHQGHPGHQGYQGHPGHHGIHSHQGYATGYAGSPSANGGHTPREAPPVPLKKKPLPPLPVPQPPMECGVAGVAGSLAGSHGPHGSPAPSPLLSASPMGGPRAAERAERSPAKHGLHVNFTEKVEVKERREKFLTAKYGSHQMALIRKRLAVEMWLFDELQKLYESSESNKTDEVDVDIDELLDMDDDNQRRIHLQRILADAKKSPLDVKKFVEDLLERTKTL